MRNGIDLGVVRRRTVAAWLTLALWLVGLCGSAPAGELIGRPLPRRHSVDCCDPYQAIGRCPDDYCRRPAPCVVRPELTCRAAYCRRPAPCVAPPPLECRDDYCRKPAPSTCWLPNPLARCWNIGPSATCAPPAAEKR